MQGSNSIMLVFCVTPSKQQLQGMDFTCAKWRIQESALPRNARTFIASGRLKQRKLRRDQYSKLTSSIVSIHVCPKSTAVEGLGNELHTTSYTDGRTLKGRQGMWVMFFLRCSDKCVLCES